MLYSSILYTDYLLLGMDTNKIIVILDILQKRYNQSKQKTLSIFFMNHN